MVFECKAGAYPSESPFRCTTLGQVLGLAHKYETKLERLARDKKSSLLRKFVIYNCKKFYNIAHRCQCHQTLSFLSDKEATFKGYLHRRCGVGDFAERCDFNS